MDDEIVVVPVGLCGTEVMFAIGEQRLGSAGITMTIGPPVTAGAIRAAGGAQRRTFVDALGELVAEQLPHRYRGVYGRS